jgi:two-component system, chemotaxis family, chemotaxis protein CheY
MTVVDQRSDWGRRDVSVSVPILVVEDDPTIREVIAEALRGEGYRVVEAADGAEAFHLVATTSHRPNLVLLDMQMPETDGWWFARKLRGAGIAPAIVVLSAALNARSWAAEIGASAYLAKPFELDDLLDVVGKFCPPDGMTPTQPISFADRAGGS